MSKHTSGPWFLSDDIPPRIYCKKSGDDEPMIACVDDSTSASLPVPEAEANARLIAAAPDLLEALQMLLAQIDPKNTEVGLGNILNAHNAIAKATAPLTGE